MFVLFEENSTINPSGVYTYFIKPNTEYLKLYGNTLLDLIYDFGISHGAKNSFSRVELGVALKSKSIYINYYDNYASVYFHTIENFDDKPCCEQKELFVGLGKKMLKMAIDDIMKKYNIEFEYIKIDCIRGGMPHREKEGLRKYYASLGFIKTEECNIVSMKELFSNISAYDSEFYI